MKKSSFNPPEALAKCRARIRELEEGLIDARANMLEAEDSGRDVEGARRRFDDARAALETEKARENQIRQAIKDEARRIVDAEMERFPALKAQYQEAFSAAAEQIGRLFADLKLLTQGVGLNRWADEALKLLRSPQTLEVHPGAKEVYAACQRAIPSGEFPDLHDLAVKVRRLERMAKDAEHYHHEIRHQEARMLREASKMEVK